MARSQSEFAAALAPLAGVFDRLRSLSAVGPAPGSAAQRESRSRIGRAAWVLAVPAAAVGLDHLVAWQHLRLKAGVQPSFAHFSLIRGAAEGCSVAQWLCDPALGPGERIARAAGAQLSDYDERIKYERGLGDLAPKPAGRGRTGEQRKVEFETALRRAGVEPIPLPRATHLFAQYFFPKGGTPHGKAFYRQISAIVHAKVWSMHAISERGDVLTHGSGLAAVALSANVETAYVATLLAMRLADEAISDIERYASSWP